MEKRSYYGPLMIHWLKNHHDKLIGSSFSGVTPLRSEEHLYDREAFLHSKVLLRGIIWGLLIPAGWLFIEIVMGLQGKEVYYRGILYLYLILISVTIFTIMCVISAFKKKRESEMSKKMEERNKLIEDLSLGLDEIQRGFKDNMIKVSNSAVEISKASDEKKVLHILMRTVKNTFDFDRVVVFIKKGESLIMSNSCGDTDEDLCNLAVELPYSEESGAFFVVCKEGESCLFTEEDIIPTEFQMKPPYSNLDRFRSKAFLVVPIRVPGAQEAYGVMAADRKYTKRGVSENDLLLVELLAEMAGSTIKRIEMNRNLEMKASLDELTQVYNRRRWMESAEHALKRAKRYSEVLSMVILDIDNFKSINDTWGHQAGDKVLREVAAIVRDFSREADIVGRYGGEEFVILCPKSDMTSTVEVAERLRRKIEKTPFGIPRQVTATFGVAEASWEEIESIDIDSLLSRADEALYVGKSRENKNCVVTWNEVKRKLTQIPKKNREIPSSLNAPLKKKRAC